MLTFQNHPTRYLIVKDLDRVFHRGEAYLRRPARGVNDLFRRPSIFSFQSRRNLSAPSGGEATYWLPAPASTTFFQPLTLPRGPERHHPFRSGPNFLPKPRHRVNAQSAQVVNFLVPTPAGLTPSRSGRGCLAGWRPDVNTNSDESSDFVQAPKGDVETLRVISSC